MSKDPADQPQQYFDDVQMQMEAKMYADFYNAKNPPKKVQIRWMCVCVLGQDVAELDNAKKSPKKVQIVKFFEQCFKFFFYPAVQYLSEYNARYCNEAYCVIVCDR